MLEWLRKLMNGDQNAKPPSGDVERDERGRITRVTQTLSLAKDGADVAAHPRPSLTTTLRPA